MKRIAFSLLFVALAVGLGIAQSSTRRVRMEITTPNGGHPEIEVYEGGTASVAIPNVGKFGFVPTVKAGDNKTLIVDVLDLSQTPPNKLDTVETSLDAPAVPTNTKPEFAVRVVYIGNK
jgi:hypothetical protein